MKKIVGFLALLIFCFWLIRGTYPEKISNFIISKKPEWLSKPYCNPSLNIPKLKKLLKSPSIQQQVKEDLAPFSEGIFSSKINAYFNQEGEERDTNHLVKFTVHKGKINYQKDENLPKLRFEYVLNALRIINTYLPLPDMEFIVSLADCDLGGKNCPVLSFAKIKGCNNCLVMPDFSSLGGYERLRKEMYRGSENFSWDKKIEKSFWRGSSTGGMLTSTNWQQFPRTKIVALSSNFPDVIDARFTAMVQCEEEIKKKAEELNWISPKIKEKDHLKFKYLIDVDGNSCTYERLFWELLSNSLVFKQKSNHIQWYYSQLEPFVHYIPFEEDGSDLIEKIKWAKTHDEECKRIAETATHFAENILSYENTLAYLSNLLQEYAKLYKNL